ncbi:MULTISPECIES: hypothetical protein [Rubrivivax]|uniref:Hydratase n=1 Tax=Rubrivivax benzoatilyticus TaxID=316997 RepID=A0ABX0HWK2_9BURK|nr:MULTISPECIES: hypothetical protein [Rubrivivax]EGJ09967.1 hypothetical protein RBXJA2T_06550 [Rubrivivax benzoatilyticus JA2 = ATCC BAA-35]NHK97933.1 hypothetical protein [Rubrivivax benzoatilyticus]NHL23435.1 hypothetical protein [Rubrivivax benzoatilyticus]
MRPALQDLAARLARAEVEGTQVPAELPGAGQLTGLADAEQVQDAVLGALGMVAASFKLGASTYGAQRALGLPRAFLAPLPAYRSLQGPSKLPWSALRQHGVECELAAALRPPTPAERALLREAPSPASLRLAESLVQSCHSAIEIPQTRFRALGAAGPLALVADNGAAGWTIVGAAGDPGLLQKPCIGRLHVDGTLVAEGDDRAFAMDPLRLLQQFLHQAEARGLLPEHATTVLLGSVTPYHALPGPCRVQARFEGLPGVELDFC